NYFYLSGYQQVNPPLLEYSETLNHGLGEVVGEQCFRLIDPYSQRMMVLRADLTASVTRIADSYLKHAPRPLRLAYCGNVLRVHAGHLRTERQFTQAGVELIGDPSWLSEREVILLALDSLKQLKIDSIALELSLPVLMSKLIKQSIADDHLHQQIVKIMETRNYNALSQLSMDSNLHHNLGLMLKARAIWSEAKPYLQQMKLNHLELQTLQQDFIFLGDHIHTLRPDIMLSVDCAETNGFGYKNGLSFTLTERNQMRIIGRGGRYLSGFDAEPAVGFSFYLNNLLSSVEYENDSQKILVDDGSHPDIDKWKQKGFSVIDSLIKPDLYNDKTLRELARVHQCRYILKEGQLIKLD
ncbi:MAG: ATP phosphoribosyltransferase regulatory subunit, partial [Pseudomonadota bacterium]